MAKISFDPAGERGLLADGYSNQRVAVIDMDTGKIKRYWGAYGKSPSDTNLGRYDPDAPLAQQFRTPVHCAEPRSMGWCTSATGPNNRIQVFRKDGKFVKEQLHRAEDPGRRVGLGHRLLQGSRAEVPLPRRREEREDLRHGPAVARRS